MNVTVQPGSRQGGLVLALLLVLLGCLAKVSRAADPGTAVLLLQFKTFFGNGDAILASWVGSDPCGQGPRPWLGVNCSSNEVTEISLSGLGLNGTIESWTAANWTLPATVQRLNLSYNALEGGLPQRWLVPSQLRVLALEGNRLSGTLPAWGGRAALVVTIRPGNPGICTRENFLSAPSPPAGNGSAYTYNSGGNVTRLPNCDDAGNLSSMMARVGRDVAPAGGGGGAGGNPMASWPDSDDSMECDQNTGAIIALHLSGEHGIFDITPEGVVFILTSGLRSLRELDLSDGALGGALPALWANASMAGFFPALQRLDISGNELTGSLAPSLSILPPNLTQLVLDGNSLTGSLPPSWTLPNLTVTVRPGNPNLCSNPDEDPASLHVDTTGGPQLAACAAPPPPPSTSSNKAVVVAAVVGAVGGAVVMGIVAWCCWRRKQRKRTAQHLKWPWKGQDSASALEAGTAHGHLELHTRRAQQGPKAAAAGAAATLGGGPYGSGKVVHLRQPSFHDPVLEVILAKLPMDPLIFDEGFGSGALELQRQLSSTTGQHPQQGPGGGGMSHRLTHPGAAAHVVAGSPFLIPSSSLGSEGSPSSGESRVSSGESSGLGPGTPSMASTQLSGHPTLGAMTAGKTASSALNIDVKPWLVNFKELELQKQIGEGSFGRVYLANWHQTQVAVKLLLISGMGLEDADAAAEAALSLSNPVLRSLQQEASFMAALRHPNIVSFLGVCRLPPCVITEYCSRGSLADVLRGARGAGGPGKATPQLSWARRLTMAIDAATGMYFLHSHSPPIVHRDLKSPNLLVSAEWRVKVSDFNLSRIVEDSLVASSVAASNPRWLAPEVLTGKGATFASDVFSFGVVLWELLTLQLPWAGSNPFQVIWTVCEGGRPPLPPGLQDLPADAHASLDSGGDGMGTAGSASSGEGAGGFPGLGAYVALMRRCWAQAPEDRPGFGEIIADLRELLPLATARSVSRATLLQEVPSRPSTAYDPDAAAPSPLQASPVRDADDDMSAAAGTAGAAAAAGGGGLGPGGATEAAVGAGHWPEGGPGLVGVRATPTPAGADLAAPRRRGSSSDDSGGAGLAPLNPEAGDAAGVGAAAGGGGAAHQQWQQRQQGQQQQQASQLAYPLRSIARSPFE